MTNTEAEIISCAIEALKDDILRKYKLFTMTPELIWDKAKAIGVKITWSMDGETIKTKEFIKNRAVHTSESFIADVKSYLFDVAVAMINLA